MTFIIVLILFGFGAIVGSFLNVLILRLPEEQSILGRSHCMNCKRELNARELVPILSYVFLRGKCFGCGSRISPRYALIEIISALLFVITFLFISNTMVWSELSAWLMLARALFIVSVMVVIFMIDLEHYLILDRIIFPSVIILFFLNAVMDLLQHTAFLDSYTYLGIIASLGLFAFFGFLYVFSKGRWIGLGDVKLALLLGLALPFPLIIVGAFLAFFLGSAVGVILIATGNKTLSSKVPFGTFLAVSTVLSIWVGEPLLHWYLGILGMR
jgi:leader peptidase (prepilin peptidase) / N-methyltransferase